MVRTVVCGASGYIGGEAARLLLAHPDFELVGVCGSETAGSRLDAVIPALRGFTDLVVAQDVPPADAYVLAMGHGEAMRLAPTLGGRIVDLSGDFRLQDAAAYERYYKRPHSATDLLPQFAYGIPEINADAIRESRLVAAGGCFATAAILSLWPLRRLAVGTAIVDGKTGSSGSGVRPGEKTHHPFRDGAFFPYEPFHHRHVPEIEQATGVKVLFQPHSTPLVRGVFTTSYITLAEAAPTDVLLDLFRAAYTGSRFVRVSQGAVNVANVRGSNFIDIGVVSEGRTAIVFAALDNLVKGGAGQGIQCLNLMFGFDETRGLLQAPARP